jgi:hypothetical protein
MFGSHATTLGFSPKR